MMDSIKNISEIVAPWALAILSVVGFFMNMTLRDLKEAIKELRISLSQHSERLAVVETEVRNLKEGE